MTDSAAVDAQLPEHLRASSLMLEWMARARAAEDRIEELDAAVSRGAALVLAAESENERLRADLDEWPRCEAEAGANSATEYLLWECSLRRGHWGEHIATPESCDNSCASWTDASTRFPEPRDTSDGVARCSPPPGGGQQATVPETGSTTALPNDDRTAHLGGVGAGKVQQ